MPKNTQLLIISHSFLKKINTDIYRHFFERFQIQTLLISTKNLIVGKKIIKPDYINKPDGINLIFKRTIFSNLRKIIYLGLFKEIKKKNITHVILDLDLISAQSIILLLSSIFFNFKILYYSNENSIIEDKNIIRKKIKLYSYKLINLFFSKKILSIICYTKQIKNNMDFCGFERKTKIIPLGFNKKIFFNLNKKKCQEIIISYFGKISHNKGVHTLLKSLNALEFKNWKFYIDLYDIESLNYFKFIKKDLKKLFYKEKLKIIKPNHNNIHEFMKITNLTVVPSEWNEQYGRVIQEAIACGSIVIGSNIGSIPEIIKKKEFLFEPGNIESLKNKIDDVCRNYNNYRDNFNEVETFTNTNRSIDRQAELLHAILN